MSLSVNDDAWCNPNERYSDRIEAGGLVPLSPPPSPTLTSLPVVVWIVSSSSSSDETENEEEEDYDDDDDRRITINPVGRPLLDDEKYCEPHSTPDFPQTARNKNSSSIWVTPSAPVEHSTPPSLPTPLAQVVPVISIDTSSGDETFDQYHNHDDHEVHGTGLKRTTTKEPTTTSFVNIGSSSSSRKHTERSNNPATAMYALGVASGMAISGCEPFSPAWWWRWCGSSSSMLSIVIALSGIALSLVGATTFTTASSPTGMTSGEYPIDSPDHDCNPNMNGATTTTTKSMLDSTDSTAQSWLWFSHAKRTPPPSTQVVTAAAMTTGLTTSLLLWASSMEPFVLPVLITMSTTTYLCTQTEGLWADVMISVGEIALMTQHRIQYLNHKHHIVENLKRFIHRAWKRVYRWRRVETSKVAVGENNSTSHHLFAQKLVD